MSRKIGNAFIICDQEGGICEMCGAKAELRPYGPGGKNVCFDCGMKDEAEAERQFRARLDGREEQL